ncbi:MAG: hypothetical protein KGK07_16985, partial [Chloroflexota bacterium]|nr:hypothetical protein [Chloroflexota bacterium]
MVVQLAISLALGVLARALQPKPDSPIDEDLPTPTSQRGTQLPLVFGRQRVAPVQAWFGARYSREEGGKGKGGALGGGDGIKTYYEQGWHHACVGPATRLYRIRQGGKAIFVGAVDPISTPSGATISCGKEGSLRVYWGNAGGPVNAGVASALGISSSWPLLTNFFWTPKRLGPSPQWQAVDYELEVRAQAGFLANSPAWIDATLTPSGTPRQLVAAVNGLPGTAKLSVQGDHAAEYQSGDDVRLSGTGADGDYTVSSASYLYGTGTPGVDFVLVDRTTIVLASVLSGAHVAPATGTVEKYLRSQDDGVNAAHVVAQLLFAPHPYGRGLRTDHWNLASLEYLGELCAAERLAANLTVRGTLLQAVAAILLDLGVLVGQDAGKLRFKEVREVDPDLVPLLVPDLKVRPLPQLNTSHDDAVRDRLIYSFSDRARNFRTFTLAISDDGRAALARSV